MPQRARAWGCTGHEVVALIALDQMDRDTRAKLERALAKVEKNYPERYCSDIDLPSIAYFATWADDYRHSHPETATWHYWNLPLERTAGNGSEYCESDCVLQAITEQTAILNDRSKPEQARLYALMFLIHFVADVHQPLHAEDNMDRGGNCVPIDFLDKHTEPRMHDGKATANYSPNLHGIWDTELVEHVSRGKARNKESMEEFAARLNREYGSAIRGWRKENDPLHWALESHALARDEVYGWLPSPIFAVRYTHPVSDCGENNTSAKYAALHEAADPRYIEEMRRVVEMRLAAAGARLAAWLERNWPSDWK